MLATTMFRFSTLLSSTCLRLNASNCLVTVTARSAAFSICSSRRRDASRRRLEQIEKAAERAVTVTRQLLAFSRKQVLLSRVLNLNIVVANMSDRSEERRVGKEYRVHRARGA